MKKNNCKGFLLAETLIVSSFIAIILIYLFVQFRNINNNYNKTLRYNGVNELYLLNEIKKYLEVSDLEKLSLSISHEGLNYHVLNNCDPNIFDDVSYCRNLFSSANIVNAIYMDNSKIVYSDDFSDGLNEFIKTISETEGMYVIIAEFSDGSFASLKLNGFLSPTLEEALEGNTIYSNISSGPGLYYDTVNSSKPVYVFRSSDGDNLNNNIEFLGYKGKIISMDDQGVKVFLSLKENVFYDNKQSYFTSDTLISSGGYESSSINNSSLFFMLNNNLEINEKVNESANYNVGKIGSIIGNSLNDIIRLESSTTINMNSSDKYAATLSVSDIIRANLNPNCNYNSISNDCLLQNWLVLSENIWTMNYSSANSVWSVNDNRFESVSPSLIKDAYTIIYLDPSVLVLGDGSKDFPYKLK